MPTTSCDLWASPTCPPVLQLHRGRKALSTDKRLIGKHFAYKKDQRNRCRVCSKHKSPEGKKNDIKTSWFCPKSEVYLCNRTCFEIFHTKFEYWRVDVEVWFLCKWSCTQFFYMSMLQYYVKQSCTQFLNSIYPCYNIYVFLILYPAFLLTHVFLTLYQLFNIPMQQDVLCM